MPYRKIEAVDLDGHPTLDERWLQDRIEADPELLGLGELRVLAREKRLRRGRLDLLLVDDDAGTRYEVELQLGATDPDHIIRTLEYWDLERRRYPHYDHVAVLVAEDITSRFSNVIALFDGVLPVIAIQVAAYDLGDGDTALTFTTIADHSTGLAPADDDGSGSAAPDRAYWAEHSSPEVMALLDQLIEIVRGIDPSVTPKHNVYYVGLATGSTVTNYATFKPRRRSLVAQFKLPQTDRTDQRIAAAGLDQLTYDGHRYRITLDPDALDDPATAAILTDLVAEARDLYGSRWPGRIGQRADKPAEPI